uniref:Uncharacterized protein n=1 Tax=Entomoneis paludosa TaxID=265537 RepID=A0A7S3DS02_9STRA|mmetsp:Transcript_32586/g.67969  ORF Transcript_32586/g.67969 Transcript_32586/m.67969 type:complete len:357 (+) Transcript_32586:820-1890(+)
MQREGTPLKLIVWWYGTEEFDILDQTKFVPFEKARSEVSRAIQEAKLRQSQGQQLRCDEKRLLCGQKAQEADLFQFGNPNEKFLLQIYDAPSDPLENPRKPKIVGRAKTTPSSKKRKKSTDFSSNKKKPLQGVALITRKLRKAEVSSRFLENFLMAEENCPGNNAYYKRMSDLILALQKASTGGSSFIEVTLKAFQEQRLGKIGVATTLYQPSSYVPPEIDIEAATSTGSAYTARAENSNYEDDPVESASSEEPQSATGTAVSVASSDQQNRAWPVKDQEKRLAPIGPLCLHALQSDESVPDLGETSSPPHFQQIPKNNRTQRFKHLRLNLSDSEDGGWTLRSPQNSGVEPEWKDA